MKIYGKLLVASCLQWLLAFQASQGATGAVSMPLFLSPGGCTVYDSLDGLCNPIILKTFAEVKPSQSIAVIHFDGASVNGSIGYFAHELSGLVGPKGHIYAITLPDLAKDFGVETIGGHVVTGDYADRNVTKLTMSLDGLTTLPRLDAVWADGLVSLFGFVPDRNSNAFESVYRALKPRGLFILVDAETEYVCYAKGSCKYARRRALAGGDRANSIQRDDVADLISQAGFNLELDASVLKDPDPAKQPRIRTIWGSDSGGHTIGYPFVWKFRRGG